MHHSLATTKDPGVSHTFGSRISGQHPPPRNVVNGTARILIQPVGVVRLITLWHWEADFIDGNLVAALATDAFDR